MSVFRACVCVSRRFGADSVCCEYGCTAEYVLGLRIVTVALIPTVHIPYTVSTLPERELNWLEAVDYEETLKTKFMFLKHAWAQEKDSFLQSTAFKEVSFGSMKQANPAGCCMVV